MALNKARMPKAPELDSEGASLFARNTKRLAAVLAHPSANGHTFAPRGGRSEGDDEIATLAAAALKAAADGGRVAKQALERVDGLQAIVQAAEQRLARLANGSTYVGSLATPSIGATLRTAIEAGEAGAFEALGAGNATKASMRLDSSIRAALTHGTGSSSDGGMPSTPETGAVYAAPVRRLSLLDVLPSRPTTRDAVEFVRITSTDEAGVQEVEGTAKAEIEMIPEAARAEIATIAAHTTASKQVLSDVQALAGVVDRVMRGKVLTKVEDELINGPGTAGRVEGLLEQAPVFVPTDSTEAADIVGEALARLTDLGYLPGVVMLNPLDWHAMQVQRATPSGEYLFGSPAAPIPPALWNVPVVLTSTLPRGTGMVADLAYVTLLDRQRIVVEASEHHGDNFVKNLITVRCECRIGLEVADQNALRQFELNIGSSGS